MRLTLLPQPQRDVQLQMIWTQTIQPCQLTVQYSLEIPLLQNLCYRHTSQCWRSCAQLVTRGPARHSATPKSLVPSPVQLSDRAAASNKNQFRRYMDVTNQIIINSQQQQPPACTPFEGNSAITSVQPLQGLHICSQRPLWSTLINPFDASLCIHLASAPKWIRPPSELAAELRCPCMPQVSVTSAPACLKCQLQNSLYACCVAAVFVCVQMTREGNQHNP